MVFLGVFLHFSSTLLQFQELVRSHEHPEDATSDGQTSISPPEQQRVLELLNKKPAPVKVEIVDTSAWAKPSTSYTIVSADLWEISDESLPAWMKDYFRWHKEQTSLGWDMTSPDLRNSYLYVTCLKEYQKCGGTADRLLSLPFFVKVAAATNRVLLIQWTKPAALEEFLLPPVSGIDWRVPKGMGKVLQRHFAVQKAGTQDTILEFGAQTNVTVVQVKFQSHDHGSVYYDTFRESLDEPNYETVFHSMWRIFFTPAPALTSIIEATLTKVELVPGQYTSAHVRALYATDKREFQLVKAWTTNSINCAITLQLPSKKALPVYFASDSDPALRFAPFYGRSRGLKVVTRTPSNNDEDPLHIDKTKDWQDRPASDFYDVFVDLYLMGLGKCVSYGMGGFGQFASLISQSPTCSMVHMSATSVERCDLPSHLIKKRRNGSYTVKRHTHVADSNAHFFLPPMPLAVTVDKNRVMIHRDYNEDRRRAEESLFPDPLGPRSARLWDDSQRLPIWMKDYFTWHREQRKLITEGNWQKFKYVVMVCLRNSPRCGGTADRLRPVPLLVRVAAETKRILLIKWENPAPLEAFLLPPMGGVDWRTPEWMVHDMRANGVSASTVAKLVEVAGGGETVVMAHIQAHDHGSDYYNSQGEINGDGSGAFRLHYRDCWYSMFTPVPEIAGIVEDELENMNLVPGEFAYAHLRSLYGIELEETGREQALVQNWTRNALNCVSNLRPGGPFLFSSDSSYAKEVALEYGRERNVKVVARLDNGTEPLHMDLASNWENRRPSEYYPIFIDLYLMSLGKCFAYNMGGFAKWGNLISGKNFTCNVRHWTAGVDKKSADKEGCQWTDLTSITHRTIDDVRTKRPLFLPPIDSNDN